MKTSISFSNNLFKIKTTTMNIPGIQVPIGPPAPSMLHNTFETIGNSMASVGMSTPLARLAGVSGITAGALYLIKPTAFFNNDGSARPWSMWASQSDNPTILPFWLFALGTGSVAALFI